MEFLREADFEISENENGTFVEIYDEAGLDVGICCLSGFCCLGPKA